MRERSGFEKEIQGLGVKPEFEFIAPDRIERIDSLIRRKKSLQQWRIVNLLGCGAVELTRDGVTTSLSKPEQHVRAGDIVQIPEQLPQACRTALANPPAPEFRDYAFAPGNTDYDKYMRLLLKRRPDTKLINDRYTNTVMDFFRVLASGKEMTNPIRFILLASHSHPEGLLKINFTRVTDDFIDYEDLEKIGSSIVIPDAVLTPRPIGADNKPIPCIVHLKGCSLGSAPPFLTLLKKKLGNKVQLTAPMHFHRLITRDNGRILVEYMAYDFTVRRPEKYKNWKEAISEFSDSKRDFTLIDKTLIPEAVWKAWIPERLWKTWKTGTDPRKYYYLKVPASVVWPLTNKAESINAYVRYRLRIGKGAVPGLSKDPVDHELRKQEVKKFLETLPSYSKDHAFPKYVRFGYKSMDEYLDGWTWKFEWKAGALHYSQIRHEYTVMRPIVDPSDRQLIMNLYAGPKEKSPKPLLSPKPLQESDRTLFYWV